MERPPSTNRVKKCLEESQLAPCCQLPDPIKSTIQLQQNVMCICYALVNYSISHVISALVHKFLTTNILKSNAWILPLFCFELLLFFRGHVLPELAGYLAHRLHVPGPGVLRRNQIRPDNTEDLVTYVAGILLL